VRPTPQAANCQTPLVPAQHPSHSKHLTGILIYKHRIMQVNFVPTHHWLPPRYGRGVQAGVGSYCAMDGTSGTNQCIPWTDALVAEFRDSMTVCFAEAFKNGLTVNVRPHLVRGWAFGWGASPATLQPAPWRASWDWVLSDRTCRKGAPASYMAHKRVLAKPCNRLLTLHVDPNLTTQTRHRTTAAPRRPGATASPSTPPPSTTGTATMTSCSCPSPMPCARRWRRRVSTAGAASPRCTSPCRCGCGFWYSLWAAVGWQALG